MLCNLRKVELFFLWWIFTQISQHTVTVARSDWNWDTTSPFQKFTPQKTSPCFRSFSKRLPISSIIHRKVASTLHYDSALASTSIPPTLGIQKGRNVWKGRQKEWHWVDSRKLWTLVLCCSNITHAISCLLMFVLSPKLRKRTTVTTGWHQA